MKSTLLALVALSAQVALSVPHGGHKRAHGKRNPQLGQNFNQNGNWWTATTTFTTVTTVTDPAAVVWVDQNNNIISTEFKSQPTPAPAPAENSVSAAAFFPTAAPQVEQAAPAPPAPPPAPASSAPVQAFNADADRQVPAGGPGGQDDQGSRGGQSGQTGDTQSSAGSKYGRGGLGICYDLMGTQGNCRTPDQMNQELGYLKSQGFSSVRSYDYQCDVGGFVTACGNNGMSCMIGLNGVDNWQANLQTLIQKVNGNWGPVHTVNIGNEVPGQATIDAVNGARSVLQAAKFSGSVVTVAETGQHEQNPGLCGASDYCAVNAHAFYDVNTSADQTGPFVKTMQGKIAARSGGKKVVITESGWPKAGDSNGAAVPGVAQQQQAIGSLKSAFSGNPDELFLFQAYDATYKAPGYKNAEPHFGIYG